MTEKIKLTSDELRLMSLFQNVTSAVARDCIVDNRMERVIFVVNKGQMGQAIVIVDPSNKGVVVGKDGRNAEKARLLAKRYFQISSVLIVSPEQSPNIHNKVNL